VEHLVASVIRTGIIGEVDKSTDH